MEISNLIESKVLMAALSGDGSEMNNWLHQLSNHELVLLGDAADTISLRIDLILASRESER